MPRKAIPLSLRISDDDAAFLANYTPEGAATPSEKVRHLIAEARERAEAKGPEDGRTAATHVLAPARKRWRDLEAKTGRNSDLVLKLYDRAAELLGRMIVGPHAEDELEQFEADLAREAARTIEDLLALQLGGNTRAYNDGALGDELSQAMCLLERMPKRKTKEKANA
ncbi:MAG: hypothetical protein AAF830_07700 [Pseudomonadota bacterium]